MLKFWNYTLEELTLIQYIIIFLLIVTVGSFFLLISINVFSINLVIMSFLLSWFFFLLFNILIYSGFFVFDLPNISIYPLNIIIIFLVIFTILLEILFFFYFNLIIF